MLPEHWLHALRQTMIDFLAGIANPSELTEWTESPLRRGSMKELAEWFVDVFQFPTGTHDGLGVYVRDVQELALLTEFSCKVEMVGNRIGWAAPDTAWLNVPEWQMLHRLAADLLILLRYNEQQSSLQTTAR